MRCTRPPTSSCKSPDSDKQTSDEKSPSPSSRTGVGHRPVRPHPDSLLTPTPSRVDVRVRVMRGTRAATPRTSPVPTRLYVGGVPRPRGGGIETGSPGSSRSGERTRLCGSHREGPWSTDQHSQSPRPCPGSVPSVNPTPLPLGSLPEVSTHSPPETHTTTCARDETLPTVPLLATHPHSPTTVVVHSVTPPELPSHPRTRPCVPKPQRGARTQDVAKVAPAKTDTGGQVEHRHDGRRDTSPQSEDPLQQVGTHLQTS